MCKHNDEDKNENWEQLQNRTDDALDSIKSTK